MIDAHGRFFFEDICAEIHEYMEEGDNTVLMMDGNEDMRQGSVKTALEALTLKECLLEKHQGPYKSTYRRNNKKVPID
jgi:hypothetical protein